MKHHFLCFWWEQILFFLVFFVYRSNFGDSSVIWVRCQIKLNSLLLSSKWFSVSIGTIRIRCAFNGHLKPFALDTLKCFFCLGMWFMLVILFSYSSRSFRVNLSYSKLLVLRISSLVRTSHFYLEWLHCTWSWSYLLTIICNGLCDIIYLQICQWGAGVIGWSLFCYYREI